MKLIERKQYMDKMISVIGTFDIKVITSVRRCGKSKLLDAFKDYIEENIPENNIIHINFNLSEFEKAINGLYATEKYDIYIIGSNVFLLSFDIATLFTGKTFVSNRFIYA